MYLEFVILRFDDFVSVNIPRLIRFRPPVSLYLSSFSVGVIVVRFDFRSSGG